MADLHEESGDMESAVWYLLRTAEAFSFMNETDSVVKYLNLAVRKAEEHNVNIQEIPLYDNLKMYEYDNAELQEIKT